MASNTKWRAWTRKKTGRNQNWTENETSTLLTVWFKFLDVLKLHRRTGKIYEKMALEFAQCGYRRSAGELQKKVSNLIQEYRKEKNKTMNGDGPSTWKFYRSVEDVVHRLSSSRDVDMPELESDSNNADNIKFMAVFLKEQSMMTLEEQDPSLPTIVSVESRAEPIAEEVTIESEPPLLVPQQGVARRILQDLKTEMHRVLEESLDLHRQQINLQQRQVVLQEDMLKIMARFIDNCP